MLKKSKNWDFSKRVTHGFGLNGPFFKLLFSGNIGQENVFYDTVERKNACLSYKKKDVQKLENLRFFQTG